MMQVYSDMTPGADRASKFKVRKVRRDPPTCKDAEGVEGACPSDDEISLR